ncbi:hypothetical protein C8A00DRAFT_40606 [Chaetomidium leptoderma]|uniref:Phosphoribosylaminoimidazole-succinocarboxamide synthase n=1 Tax=Chaetomidium leptoderma TaxID=669021 RepID=A0AAN6VSJ8_9PEZI|nr:hypothetical protein C8A00DRAFT_40606 [Chaetomidium leptoderma]
MSSHNSNFQQHAEHLLGPHPQHPRPVSPLTPTPSEPDLHAQDGGIFGPPVVARSYGRPVIIEGPYRRVPDIPAMPPYQQPAWETALNTAMLTDFRDDLARLDGVVTPGIDNTPFVQYAIEALSRDRDTGYSAAAPSGSGSSTAGPALPPGGQQPQFYQHRPSAQQPPPSRASLPARPLPAHPPAVETPRPHTQHQQLPRPIIPGPRESAHSLAESLLKKKGPRPQPHEWRPVENDELLVASDGELPPLTFRPWPLRAPALFAFMAVCLLMIAALILSAVYSHLHQGLLEWATIHGGRYFLFRLLPQLIAAFMLLYCQCMVTTMFRMLPFVRLASQGQGQREGALFQELYPSFLWPRLVGPWNVWVPVLVTWLMNFTIPLQSSLFTVILVNQTWTWATVQGVAWTLVALYLALLASTIITWRYWASIESTGLLWDPRSLADMAALVSETNTAEDYRGTQLARGREGMRFALRRRAADRLCYWTWKDGRHGFWHTLGSPMDEANLIPTPDPTTGERMQRHDEKQHPPLNPDAAAAAAAADNNIDLENPHHNNSNHHRHLPFPLRTSQLLWFTLTTTILLLAIFIATFHPSTRLAAGFLLRPTTNLPSTPQPGAFSPADFFFSFVPALLGTFVFLLFQSLDSALRVLQPWAALKTNSGSGAEVSLLADYAACAPGQCTVHALRNRHWRVAGVSLLAGVFVLIPVLAGGSFMALTSMMGQEEEEVRMFANMPAYGMLLGLLVLYLVGLLVLFPGRAPFRLPHGVTCLAEIVGYLVNADIREEPAFKRCVTRREMAGKMGVARGLPGEMQSRWVFGFGEENNNASAEGGGELGVRRVRRFTEKRKVRKSQIRRALF